MNGESGERFTAAITVNFGALDHDLWIELPPSATGSDLYRLLGSTDSGLGLNRTPPLLTSDRTGRALGHDERLLGSELLNGDRLVAVADRAVDPDPSVLMLEFLTGPRRGEALVVPDERCPVVLGRAADAGFEHRSVSRDHARLDLTATGVTVADLGSTNGTTVNGVALEPDRVVAVHPGDVIEIGDVNLTVTGLPPGRRAADGAPFHRRGSQLDMQPAPRAVEPRPLSTVTLPDPPSEPPKRRFPIGAAILPLVLGAVMAMVFTPIFAVFMAMSPLMVVWTFFDDRRSGRRNFAAARDVFLDDLESQRLVAADTADRLAAWRRRRTPTLDQIARWVRCGSSELWARRPRHDDFLTVAIGTSDRPSSLEVTVPDHGAPELVAASVAVADGVSIERAARAVVDLGRHPVVALTGGTAAVDVARSLVAQLVGLRSPRDLELVMLAPDHQHEWEWTKWLPHTKRPDDDAAGGSLVRSIAGDDDEAHILFAELVDGAERRAAAAGDRIGRGRGESGPHVVVVLHPPVGLSPASVARFLDMAPAVGMSVLFVSSDGTGLPAESTLSIGVTADGRSVDVHDLAVGVTITGVDPWRVDVTRATALARDLSPLVDVTVSGAAADIPVSVSLQDVHADPAALVDAEAMVRRWAEETEGLAAILGADADGPVPVDLRADGPHGLVAGTTGSGKSELLQTMIADLAARHSPADLNFILIDYKGGSAFRECERLPHTVGFVTDLDDHLAARALISLRAELRHRERVLAEMGVSDLAAMRSRFRHSVNSDVVLPSLVIVIDEFAALRTEVPDFVDGLVDVAQRGRSMGVHMVLATQKPGGVVTPQIDANTNIRVALRVSSEADSRDLIGVTDAAHIATDRPGRALLKIGGGSSVTPFQSAYVGGRSSLGGEGRISGLAAFTYGMRPGGFRVVEMDRGDGFDNDGSNPDRSNIDRSNTDRSNPDGCTAATTGTDLERIVDTAVAAWRLSRGGRGLRRPWLPPLPPVVPFKSLGATARGLSPESQPEARGDTLRLPVGLADLPRTQTQEVYSVDLDQAGNVAVYGSPGSGKTVLLRTVACSLSLAADPVVVYGIDFGGGLGDVEALPAVADVVGGGDLERLQLLVTMVENEVSERLHSGSAAGAIGDRDVRARIVVLIDGFGPFWDTLESFDFGRQADRFARLLSQAPSAGVHVIMTADQRSAIPYSCLGSIGLRLLQRLASPDEYRSLGMTSPPDPESMTSGRTFAVGGPEVQMALVDDDDLAGVIDTVRDRGSAATGRPVRALSDTVHLDEIARPGSLSVLVIGLGPSHDEVAVDLVDQPTFLIAGAAGSGRSTALATMGVQLASIVTDRRAVVPKRTSPLAAADRSSFRSLFVGDDAASALGTLAAEIEERARTGHQRPMVLAVDDADVFFDDNQASAALNRIVLKGRDGGAVVLMTASSFRAGTAYETWIRAMRSNGHGLVLQPDGDRDEDLFDVRFPRGSALRFPVGRGYLVVRSTVRAVQVATSGPGSDSASASLSEGDGRMDG